MDLQNINNIDICTDESCHALIINFHVLRWFCYLAPKQRLQSLYKLANKVIYFKNIKIKTIRIRPSAMGFEFHVNLLPKNHAGGLSLFIIYLKVIFSVAKAFIGFEILLCPLISSKIDFFGNINTIFNRSYRTGMRH